MSSPAAARSLLKALKAFELGDFSVRLPPDRTGIEAQIAVSFNAVVRRNEWLVRELARVGQTVGREGLIYRRIPAGNASGSWADAVQSVNSLITDLAYPTTEMARVICAVANGDLTQRVELKVNGHRLRGQFRHTARTVNTMVKQLNSFASEVSRVAREVGTEGHLGGQARVVGVAGTWKNLTENVNSMASNLTSQVRNIAAVTTAVAEGDLSRKITVPVRGEMLELKNTINTMVDQLRSFASEVTRVAREVGTKGRLGGQARVRGVAGTWQDLTDNVNLMASNLTNQVRGIARVVTAVANGDLTRKLTVDAEGEIAALARTINGMIETLATFAEQVTSVAREVGVEGKLGGQASVPGAAGTWKNLTDNVNRLAANLTTQVRAIAEVATAVTKGDLTQSINVQARGEVAALKDNINEMIRNLKETTSKSSEQDWLKTNLANFSRMLQGQRDAVAVGKLILSELVPVVSAQQAAFYILDAAPKEPRLKLLADYARDARRNTRQFRLGDGLLGQCALEKRKIMLSTVPKGYFRIGSGLGSAVPSHLVVLPVLFEGQVKGVMELASFEPFSSAHLALLEPLLESIGVVLNTIEANQRKEDLLNELLEISDREQRRIGQDLHDDLCQRLAGVEMMSQFLEQRLADQSNAEAATACEITRLIRQAISHTRDLARGLSPVMLESDGLMPALQELAANAQPLFKVSCQFHGDASIQFSDSTAATHLYRIAQEALTNAIKHGRAKQVIISLTRIHDRVMLVVRDDGIGLPQTAHKTRGMGLRIMQYRAGMVGGTLTAQREPQGGTSVTCAFQLSSDTLSARGPS